MATRGGNRNVRVAAPGRVGYKGPLPGPRGNKEERFVAATKTAKKAAKAAKKSATPVAKKAVSKPVVKKAAVKAAKPEARKAAVKAVKPVAKKAVAKVTKPVVKKAAAKTAKPVVKKAAAKTARPVVKKAAAKTARPVVKKAVAKTAKPVVKKVADKAVKAAAANATATPAAPVAKKVAAAGVAALRKGGSASRVASASPAVVDTARPAPPATSPTPAKATGSVSKSKQSGNPVSVSKTPAKTASKTAAPAKPVARPAGKVAVAVTSPVRTNKAAPKYKVVEYSIDEATGRPVLPAGYKPSADEEYMSPLQQEYFRQRLITWRADLVEESKQTIENLREEVRDIGDEAERATRETENSLELRTRDRYRKLIGKIDSTLKRLEAGDYGYCVDTGEEIGLDRLEARLTAERTIDAQERWEHLQKQQGD